MGLARSDQAVRAVADLVVRPGPGESGAVVLSSLCHPRGADRLACEATGLIWVVGATTAGFCGVEYAHSGNVPVIPKLLDVRGIKLKAAATKNMADL